MDSKDKDGRGCTSRDNDGKGWTVRITMAKHGQ